MMILHGLVVKRLGMFLLERRADSKSVRLVGIAADGVVATDVCWDRTWSSLSSWRSLAINA